MQAKNCFWYARLWFIAVVAPLDAWGALWLVQTFGWGLPWEVWFGIATLVLFMVSVCRIAWLAGRVVRVKDGGMS